MFESASSGFVDDNNNHHQTTLKYSHHSMTIKELISIEHAYNKQNPTFDKVRVVSF